MKWQAQRNRLAALAARLSPQGTTIKIVGGLPPDFAPAKPQPPGQTLLRGSKSLGGARRAFARQVRARRKAQIDHFVMAITSFEAIVRHTKR
jgi:hypothetical protein